MKTTDPYLFFDGNCAEALSSSHTFWGARFAMLTDKFGFGWMLSTPLNQKK